MVVTSEPVSNRQLTGIQLKVAVMIGHYLAIASGPAIEDTVAWPMPTGIINLALIVLGPQTMRFNILLQSGFLSHIAKSTIHWTPISFI